jgi:tetratricopeptide (TPR) repeat protein
VIADVLEGDPTAAADSDAWDRLGEFVERDPDVPNGFRFRHALIRDSAYEGLSYRRRRELHGRIAEVLERRQPEAVELLSLHFHRAERAAETWRYSLDAGGGAQAKWANHEATQFYERALEWAKAVQGLDSRVIAEVWESLGDCLHLIGRFERAAEAYEAARELLPKRSQELVELIAKEGLLREDMGRYEEAIRWYGRGLRAAEQLPASSERDRLQNQLNLYWAFARYREGDFQDCIKRCTEIFRRALEIDDQQQLGDAYLLLHLVHTQIGSPERVAFRGLALPIFEELGNLKRQATVLNNLGIDAYYEGDWAKALDVYERSRALFERIGDVTNVAMAKNNIGEILSDQGKLEEAEALFHEVREAVDPTGHRGLSLMARLNLGRAAARAGRFDEAEQLLSEARDGFREIQASSFEQEAHARLAEAAVLAGDPERALREIEFAELVGGASAPPQLQAVLFRVRGYAHLQMRRPEEAVREFERSLEAARQAGALYEIGLSLRAKCLVRRSEADAAESEQLLNALQVLRAPEIPQV